MSLHEILISPQGIKKPFSVIEKGFGLLFFNESFMNDALLGLQSYNIGTAT